MSEDTAVMESTETAPQTAETLEELASTQPAIEAEPEATEPEGLIPPDVAAEHAAIIARAQELNKEITLAKLELARLEGKAKQAKRDVEDQEKEIAELQEQLEALFRPAGPLFEPKTEGPKAAELDGQTGDGTKTPAADDDSWRADRIADVLGLKSALVQKLAEANVHTLGDLQDWTDPTKHGGYQQRITDIPGIGAKKAEAIEEAMTAYWAKRAETKAAATTDAPVSESEADDENGLPGEADDWTGDPFGNGDGETD